jgi:hypothetical protein
MEWRGNRRVQRALCVLSLLAFPAGLVIGAVLVMQPDDESKRVGMACLVCAGIGLIVLGGLWALSDRCLYSRGADNTAPTPPPEDGWRERKGSALRQLAA